MIARIPAFVELTDTELRRRFEELAEDIGPKMLVLESLIDELKHRERERQRQKLLTPPWESDPADSSTLNPD